MHGGTSAHTSSSPSTNVEGTISSCHGSASMNGMSMRNANILTTSGESLSNPLKLQTNERKDATDALRSCFDTRQRTSESSHALQTKSGHCSLLLVPWQDICQLQRAGVGFATIAGSMPSVCQKTCSTLAGIFCFCRSENKHQVLPALVCIWA